MVKNDLLGMIYAILASFFYANVTCIVRHLSGNFDPFLLIFYRVFSSLLILLPFILVINKSILRVGSIKLNALRGLNSFASMITWFIAISHINITTAVSLSFTTPLLTVFLAKIILKERLTTKCLLGLLIGFLGTLIILRPGFSYINIYLILVLLSSLLWAFSGILMKKMADEKQHPIAIVLYMNLVVLPLSIPFAIKYWQPPGLIDVVWLIALGIVSDVAQIMVCLAYKRASIHRVISWDFTRLIFVAGLAFFIFNESIDHWSVIGGIIILTSAYYVYKSSPT